MCRVGGLSYDRRTESQIDRGTSGRTDMLPRHSPRYAYASCGKNCGYVEWCRLSTEYRRVTYGQTDGRTDRCIDWYIQTCSRKTDGHLAVPVADRRTSCYDIACAMHTRRAVKIAIFTYSGLHFCFPGDALRLWRNVLHGWKDNWMLAKPLAACTYFNSFRVIQCLS